MTDNRLRLLADWLKDSNSNIDSYYDGSLETAIKQAKMDTKVEIGELLQEILDMSDDDVIKSAMNLHKKSTKYPF
jgi:hypothetical protein